MSGAYVERGHLGGYREGGDEATFYPDLWRWLVEEQGVASVVDVGCGDGQAVDFFAALGCQVLGIEGVEQSHPLITKHDYTRGAFWLSALGKADFDLAWSCEFVEHVEEQYVPNFLATFACAKLVLMTHATPGQAGYHHVNCREAGYWEEKMDSIGYGLDEKLTDQTRRIAGANLSPWNHFKRSGLAFRRDDAGAA